MARSFSLGSPRYLQGCRLALGTRPPPYQDPAFSKARLLAHPFNRSFRRPGRRGGGVNPALLHVTPFHRAQALGGAKTHYQPVSVKSIYKSCLLQNVQPQLIPEDSPKRILHGHYRYKGCLSACACRPCLQEVPSVHTGHPPFLLQGPSLRPLHRPLHLFQSTFPPPGDPQEGGNRYSGISGRPYPMGPLGFGPGGKCSKDHVSSSGSGLRPQLGEIESVANPGHGVVRGKVALPGSLLRPLPGVHRQAEGVRFFPPVRNPLHSEKAGVLPGAGGVRCPNNSRRETEIPPLSSGHRRNCEVRQGHLSTYSYGPLPPPSLVDSGGQLASPLPTASSPSNLKGLDRCLRPRLRRLHRQRSSSPSDLVRGAVPSPHQCEGAASRCTHPRGDDNPSGRERPDSFGQLGNGMVYQKPGLEQISSNAGGDGEDRPHSVLQGYHHSGDTLGGFQECGSGCPLQGGSGFDRVGVTASGVCQSLHPPKPLPGTRRDGHPHQREMPEVHLPISTPFSSGDGLLCVRPKPVEYNIRLSSPEPDFEGFESPFPLQGSVPANYPMLAKPPVVSHSIREGQGSDHPSIPPISEDRSQDFHPTRQDILDLDRVEFIKKCLRRSHDSAVSDRISRAFRSSTNSQYERCWRRFQSWLGQSDFTSINDSCVLQFLEFLFSRDQLSPKTVLTYRSAIKLPLKLGFNLLLDSQEFSLLSRAQFLARPPKRQLVPEWDINPVLDLLESPEFLNDSSSLENLLSKTIFLTALATGNRSSEITATRRDRISRIEGGRALRLAVKEGFLFKNQRMDRTPPDIVIKFLLSGNPELCPARTLLRYLDRTPSNESALLLHPISGRPLQRPSLALRLVRLVERASPGSHPKVHDLRKHAVSLAWARGVQPSDIVNAAFWSSSNVFIKRYLIPSSRLPRSCVALGSQ